MKPPRDAPFVARTTIQGAFGATALGASFGGASALGASVLGASLVRDLPGASALGQALGTSGARRGARVSRPHDASESPPRKDVVEHERWTQR